MGVEVRVPEALRRYSEGKGMVPAEGETVAAALASLAPELRARVLDENGRLRPYLLVFVGGAPAMLDTRLPPCATLEVVSGAEGG